MEQLLSCFDFRPKPSLPLSYFFSRSTWAVSLFASFFSLLFMDSLGHFILARCRVFVSPPPSQSEGLCSCTVYVLRRVVDVLGPLVIHVVYVCVKLNMLETYTSQGLWRENSLSCFPLANEFP